jgi:hypothetical protein
MTVLTSLDPAWTWLPSALLEDDRTNVKVIRRVQDAVLLSVRRNVAGSALP